MPEPKRPLKVFLSYASQDKPLVRELSRRLTGEGWIDTWQDEKNLLPGQDWRVKIEEAVEDADVVIIVLSQHSVSKEGHVQKELRYAREIALEKPEDAIFLIPLRLDECEVPRGLRFYQWVDYFGDNKDFSYKALVASLNLRYEQKIMVEEAENLRKKLQEREIVTKIAHEKAEKDAAEKTRLRKEKEERKRIAKEKAEREAADKLAREKAEKEAVEKARLEAEELARQKSAKEKAERESAEKAWFDKTWAEAEERAILKAAKEKAEREAADKLAREKIEKEVAEKARLKADREQNIKEARLKKERETSENARRGSVNTQKVNQVKKSVKPEIPTPNSGNQVVYWVGGFALLVFGMIFLSSLNTPVPTPQPTAIVYTLTKTEMPTPSKTPAPSKTHTPSKTPAPSKTPTKAFTPITPYPTEIKDSKGVTMRLVPAGEFMMGSEVGLENEQPVHRVYLEAFYMDIYEVTNELFEVCVVAGFCTPPGSSRGYSRTSYYGNSQFDNYPVVGLYWRQAQTYCEWRDASLPTEAQWEKAASGIDGRTYPWGEDISCNKANYSDCVGDTTEVGSYEAGKSYYGMYDMGGNVWEWVYDWYDKNYYQSSPYMNPSGPNSGINLVVRGGSFTWTEGSLRVSARNSLRVNGSTLTGFRCVRSLP